MDNTELNIRIDRLILEGISLTGYQQQQLKEAVEAELTAMFATKGIPKGMSLLPGNIKAKGMQLQEQKPAPGLLGKQIASSIYHGISGDGIGE